MFRLTRPSNHDIRRFLDAQHGQPFSYAEVGATRDANRCPAGYNWDTHRVPLGRGADVYARAKAALARWEMFPQPFIEIAWPDAPIVVGTSVAVLFRGGLVWSLNAARIVYVIDESNDDRSRFGFAYGTLPDHPEQGEERFSVERDRADDRVWYDVTALSRPQHPLAKLVYPYARWMQAQFRSRSGVAMQRAVGGIRPVERGE